MWFLDFRSRFDVCQLIVQILGNASGQIYAESHRSYEELQFAIRGCEGCNKIIGLVDNARIPEPEASIIVTNSPLSTEKDFVNSFISKTAILLSSFCFLYQS